jgi:hypothetical protein
VGIGTSSPAQKLDVSGNIHFLGSVFGENGSGYWVSGDNTYGAGIFGDGSTGNVLRFQAGSSERMRIDSSGSVGIGTSSPSEKLHIEGNARLADAGSIQFGSSKYQTLTGTAGSNDLLYRTYANHIFKTSTGASDNTDGTERMRIDSSGNVGIGTSSPSSLLEVSGTGYDNATFTSTYQSGGRTTYNLGPSGALLGYIGNAYQLFSGSTSDFAVRAQNGLAFATGGNQERMRIDSSGNLLVGQSSTTVPGTGNTTAGISLRGGVGAIHASRDGNRALYVNRNTTDGPVISVEKSGVEVGSIGAIAGGYLSISGTTGGRLQINGTDEYAWDTTQFYPVNDNANDLGFITKRWDDIYATNGTIQTSDRNEKQDIAELSDAEQRVAVACKGLLRKFRWKDSVAEKGDDARIHFGIIAQDLQDAFEAEGLDAGDYAMFISTTWTDEETNEEKTRMGVRYSELLAFIIAAI